jgi:hypothetical protein
MPNNNHTWSFFRAGGFDQVRIETGQDIAHLSELDQKLWVALACPTKGLEFDAETLTLLDTDKDGRIRAPEIIAAAAWATSLLKNPDDLVQSKPALPLAAINDATPEGKALLASARQILVNLGHADAAEITPEQTADTTKIFANTTFNGDGIVPADAASDPALQSIITDIIKILGAETDRSGKPGIHQKKLDLFFADAQAFAAWHDKSQSNELPLGPNSAAVAATVRAVAAKIDDFFTRCRLAAFDPRATAAVNRAETDYAALAIKDLSSASAEIAAFPLAKVAPGAALPLAGQAINPAWRSAIDALNTQAIRPLLGEKESLTEDDWAALVAKFATVDSWLAAKAGATVEPLGMDRIRDILATPGARDQLSGLIARDASLEPEANAIAAVHKLVHYHRDLYRLLINFVNFRDFYSRRAKAIFQVGTLYLDQRACELCVRADDPARHALLAHLSRTYLAYCDLTRKKADGSLDKMSIAAAYTAGDSDNLMVGRNGIFYDRNGNDWDATITKIMDNPISIRQAFFAPYKRAIRFVSEQVAKRAAAADAAASDRLQAAAAAQVASASGTAARTATPPPPPPKPKVDVGVVAALGVAAGFIIGALGAMLQAFFGLGAWMPLGVIAIILLISGPSMLIAWFKLRQRNLGPILDANGWAVNAKAKLNIPFGRSLTQTPKLPIGAHRDLVDPFAEKHTGRNWTIAIIILLLALLGLWYFGVIDRVMPNVLPRSSYMVRKEQATTQAAGRHAEEKRLAEEKRSISPATNPTASTSAAPTSRPTAAP